LAASEVSRSARRTAGADLVRHLGLKRRSVIAHVAAVASAVGIGRLVVGGLMPPKMALNRRETACAMALRIPMAAILRRLSAPVKGASGKMRA